MEHKTRTKALSWLLSLALMLGLFPGMGLTAYADPAETLLTTITATGKEQASYSTEDIATVSFSYTANGSSAYMNNGKTNWGWWGYGWTATVTAVEGNTITKCVFYDDANRSATDSEAPFVVETTESDKTPQVNGVPILADTSKGITKIEVYGYATPAHTHDFTYSASGATITATCSVDGCPLPEVNGKHTATLTIAAPLHTTAGDNKSEDARITDANKIQGTAAVSYYNADASGNRTGDALQSTPTDGGKYWVEITLTNEGNASTATAHVVYEIANPDYTITLPTGLVGGAVTAQKDGANVTKAKYNDTITLVAVPENGYHLTSLTVKDGNNTDVSFSGSDNTRTFTMPASNVTVSAAFEGQPFDVTVNSTTNGTVDAKQNSASVTQAKAGSEVTLTVTPATGYQLDTLTVTKANNDTVSVGGNKFTMPASNVTVSATFKEITYTVTANGATATVTDSTPEHHSYTAELTGLPSDKTYDGEPVTLTATVQKSDGFPVKVTVGTVSFKDQNNNIVTSATDVGTYTASATVGDKTVSKSFTIKGQTTPITYVKTTKSGNSYTAVLATTNQYIPLVNNPNGITLLKEGRIYYAKGNIEIGALVFIGNDVKLILGKDTTVTIYAGIYHIGSSLEIYSEQGGEKSELIVKGSKTLSELTNNTGHTLDEIAGKDATLSGTIGVYSGKLTVEKGNNSKLVADDISLTLGVGVSASGLTGGTENSDGSMTYGKAAFASLTSLAVKPIAVVTAVPTAKTGLTANGSAQALVNAGTANGGTMQYALGTSSAATGAYSTTIPTATAAGTYYVWYKAVGSDGDSAAAYVTVTVSSRSTPSSSSSSDSDSSSSTPSSTTTTTTTTDTTSNPDASTTNGTATVTTTTNRDGSTTEKTTETATKSGGDGSKTEVKAEATTTTKSNRDGTTTAATTTTETATTTAADGTKTVTETKTEAKETLNKSGNGTVEAKTTETVKDANGKVTATTVTESKGTVETATDGTKTTTTTNTAVTTDAAGNKTTVVTTEKATVTTDGSTGKVVSDESGKVVSVEAKISETAAESAAKSGETVTLPVTVTAAQSAEDATPVAITVPKAAESVKVEIPVEDVKPGTVAVIVHEDGTEEIVKTSTTSEGGVVLALESGASVKVVDNTKTFNDVDGDEWYAGNVAWASSREVMNGVGDNTFAPNEDTNRAMVTQILYNLDDGKASGAVTSFNDVSAGDWYADSVSWAVENGIAQGEGESFGANDPVSREQLSVMLYNYAGKKGYDVTVKGDISRFADNDSASAWASDALAWAVGVGIINGARDAAGNTLLDPQGNASRAQVTAMTERFCQKAAK